MAKVLVETGNPCFDDEMEGQISDGYFENSNVGKVVEVKGSKNDMNRIAIVEPSVNIAGIKEVAIILFYHKCQIVSCQAKL